MAAQLMPTIIKADKKPDKPGPAVAAGVKAKGKRERGIRQTPQTLGFTAVRVIPGHKGKARMERRPFPGGVG